MEERKENFFKEVIKFALLALIIVVPIRLYIAQPYIVAGASMDPNFATGNYLIVDQLSYYFENPKRGDVIVFRFPGDTSKFFIKRIIGLPGETITLDGTRVIIDNPALLKSFVLDEPYLAVENVGEDFLTRTLDEDEYFMLGDNRKASSDSRLWGALPAELIVGRAFVRLYPITEITLLPGSVKQK